MPQQNAAPRGVSVSGTARDFETTFDVDGHVETVPTADRNLPLVLVFLEYHSNSKDISTVLFLPEP